jgi:hypothetical protein
MRLTWPTGPRVSTVLSSYFYYKTACQVLLVKTYDERLGVIGVAYWYPQQ